jgi:SAM-dependent methyltransferase
MTSTVSPQDHQAWTATMSVMRLHDDPDRQRARSFGGVADDYDRARPSYPPQAIRWLLGASPVDVVDLGAGTGKLTAMLLGDGHRVVAIEPLEPLRAKLAAALPTTPALEGHAEDIPLPDSSADAVLVGQAFHWFDVEPALEEIARVLRPGGKLGLIWNFRDASQAWMRDLAVFAGQDGLRDGWTREFETLPRVATVERRDFELLHPVDRDTLVALVGSWSNVASRTEPEREQMLGRVRELWDRHPDLDRASRISLTYRTETYRVRLT